MIIAVFSPLGTLSCSGHMKIFHVGRICMYILPLPPPPAPIHGRSIKWRNSEERQLIFWGKIFQGGSLLGGIFQVGIFAGWIFLEPEGISFKKNTKHITKFLKLLKNASYRMKISKHVERNIYKCIEVFNFA